MIASIAPPLAHAHAGHGHAGHLVTLLYLAPILIGIALVAVQSVRDRRRGIQPAADLVSGAHSKAHQHGERERT